MLGYSFEVVYKTDLENKAADALSRVPPTIFRNQLMTPTLIDLKTIKEEVERDGKLKEIIMKLQNEEEVKNYSLLQGILIYYKGRLVIAKNSLLIPNIMHTYYDSILGGHSRFLRTYKRLTRELLWDGMKSEVKKYCEECAICQRNKASTLTPAGLLVPLEIPSRVWEDISMDFIERLPKSWGMKLSWWWWIGLVNMAIS